MKILCVLACALVCGHLSAYSAPKTLKTKGGDRYTGKVLIVQSKVLLIRTEDGKHITLVVDQLEAASRNAVSGWAKSVGGDLNYASWMKASKSSFSKMWPSTVYGKSSIPLAKKYVANKAKSFVHESQYFRFVSDSDLEPKLLKDLAVQCEATREYCKMLPFNLAVNHYEPGYKCEIHLFISFSGFLSAGAIDGYTMIYDPKYNRCLAYIGSSDHLEKESQPDVAPMIIDGVVRQMLGPFDYGGWFENGLSLYVASTPYSNGQFRALTDKKKFGELVQAHALREISNEVITEAEIIPGDEIEFPPLRELVEYGADFKGMKNQAAALLLIHYFCRIDQGGRADGVKKYVKSIQKGESRQDAVLLLLNGREFNEVEEEIETYYSRHGLKLRFGSDKVK
ncbi:hypothetical protein Rhal01_02806 [Rubritalea halochordaticola]|uniref:DUF4214 domain-containing protein n=1 Tax=Rubritalea halochordaticola TaxID=714537 RepID=A0ABP9V1Q9_9BACT